MSDEFMDAKLQEALLTKYSKLRITTHIFPFVAVDENGRMYAFKYVPYLGADLASWLEKFNHLIDYRSLGFISEQCDPILYKWNPDAKNKPECKTEDAVVDLIRSRGKVGRKKYGTSMDRQDLTPAQWCQHLQEELADALQYVERVKQHLIKSASDNQE
jgi:hypothetical protein